MNKRELIEENDILREALMEVYNSIETAIASLEAPIPDGPDEDSEVGEDE